MNSEMSAQIPSVLTESDSKEEINKLKTQIKFFEMKCNEFRYTNDQLIKKLKFAEQKAMDSELSAQRHAEDRKQLMAQLSDKSRRLVELESSLADKQQEIKQLDEKMAAERQQFQTDLLTTVRVAEESEQKTILECQKLRQINKDLETKLADLEIELKKYKTSEDRPTTPEHNQSSPPTPFVELSLQTNLLTTVRVAEEFKQETILECQKLRQINKDLETKLEDLEIDTICPLPKPKTMPIVERYSKRRESLEQLLGKAPVKTILKSIKNSAKKSTSQSGADKNSTKHQSSGSKQDRV